MQGNQSKYGTSCVVNKTGITPERLRYWEKLGVVRPDYVQCGSRQFRKYSAEDIHRAIMVKMFVEIEKYTLAGAIKKLEEEEQKH